MKFKSDIEVQAGIKDKDGQIGSSGQILASTGSQVDWIDQSDIISASSKLVVIACKNTSGATITKGTPVYQTGTVGATDVIEIAKADASDENKMAAIGLLQTDIVNNAFGNVVITGELLNLITSPIDGTTPTTGDTIYVKPGGGLTLTKPTGVNFIQNVGLIGKVSTGNSGSITVSSIMRSNDVPTPLYIDHANQRLGIGITSPSEKLEVDGNIKSKRITLSHSGYTGYINQAGDFGGGPLYIRNMGQNHDINFQGNKGGTTSTSLHIDGLTHNIGIGTTSPSEKLEVSGNVKASTGNNNISIVPNNTNSSISTTSQSVQGAIISAVSDGLTFSSRDIYGGVNIGSFNNAGTVTLGAFGYGNVNYQTAHASFAHTWYGSRASDPWMTLNSTGLGIGTTSPSQLLHLSDDDGHTQKIQFGLDSIDNHIGVVAYDTFQLSVDENNANGNSAMTFRLDGQEAMRVSTQRNVGIGTTSPSSKLHVDGDIRQQGSTYSINITGGGTITGDNHLDIAANNSYLNLRSPNNSIYYRAGGDHAFRNASASNEYLRIKTSGTTAGNVGIGTSSPDSLLEISTTDTTKNFIKLTSGAGSVNPTLIFEKSATEQGVIQYIRNGDLKLYNTDSDGGVMISGSGASNYDMYINNSGNVGIGTTSPDYALHVDPTVKIGDRQGTDGSLILQSQQGPNITFTSTGDNLDISGSTGSSNGNTIRLLDEIKVFEFHANIGGTIRINRGNRGLMDTNIGGYVVQQQNTTSSNGKSTFLSTDSSGTILRSTSYGSTGTSGDIQFQFGGGNNTSEPAPATKVIIKNDGNVGIGTTSPSEKLDVTGYVKASPGFKAGNYTILSESGNETLLSNSAYYPMFFKTNNSVRMTISNAGNVGIGTTSPAEKLHVATDVRVDGSGGVAVKKIRSGYFSSSQNLDLQSGSSADIILTSDKVGIGTTSPDKKLEVFGDIKISGGDYNGLFFENASGTTKTLLYQHAGYDALVIKDIVNNADRVTFKNNGNVGIGATSPSEKLVVQDGKILAGHTNTKGYGFHDLSNYSYTANTGRLSLVSNGLEAVSIDSSQRVGIGTTSPSVKLDVAGDIISRDTYPTIYVNHSGTTLGGIRADATTKLEFKTLTTAPISFQVNSSQKMLITDSGNVGIGTNNPSNRLQVTDGSIGIDSQYAIRDNRNNTILQQSADTLLSNRTLTIGNATYSNIIVPSGNVGIGTTSPEAKLTIKGDALNTNQPVRITNSVTDTHTGLFLNNTGATVGEKYGMQFGGYNQYSIGGIFGVLDSVSGSTSGDITFDMCNGTSAGSLIERMRITHEGNVGIGTNSPFGTAANRTCLSVNGSTDVSLNIGTGGVQKAYLYSEGSYARLATIGSIPLTLGVNDTERMRIDSSGNVGIGTTSPGAKLDVVVSDVSVVPNGSSSAVFRRNGDNYISILSSASGEGGVLFGNSSDAVDGWIAYKNGSGNQYMTIGTADTERMRIDSSGNVGIGEVSPDSLLHLSSATGPRLTLEDTDTSIGVDSVIADISFVGGEIGGETARIAAVSETAGGEAGLRFHTGQSVDERLRIDKDGNVGIGETSPDFRLDVSKGYTSGNGKVAKFRSGNDATFVNFDTVQVVQQDVPCLAIIETSTGTQSDEQKLTFAVGDNKAIIGSTSTVTNGMSFYTNRAVTTTGFTPQGNLALHLANNGNVGIGTTNPSYKLEVHDNTTDTHRIRVINGNTGQSGLDLINSQQYTRLIAVNNKPFYVYDQTANSELFTIKSGGNVGIGATSPSTKLHLADSSDVYLTLESTSATTPEEVAVKYSNQPTGSNYWWQGLNQSADWSLGYGTSFSGSSTKLLVDTSGNVGIGTTSPQNLLHLGDNTNSKAGTIRIDSFVANQFWKIEPGTNTLNIKDYDGTSLVSFDGANNYALFNGGNVGIGTTSPTSPLTIKSNSVSSSSSGLTIQSNSNTNNIFELAEKSTDGARLQMYDAGVAKIALYTDGTDNYINAGNVGIGTTSPSARLEVLTTTANKFVRFRADNNEQRFEFYVGASGNASRMSMHNDAATETIRFASAGNSYFNSGNVGIGTNNPTRPLYVKNASAQTVAVFDGGNNSAGEIGFKGSGTTGETYVTIGAVGNDMSLSAGAAEKVRITSSGNVGIGTTSPNRKLTVIDDGAANGSQNITAQFSNQTSGATSSALYIGASTGADWLIGKNIYGVSSQSYFQIGNQAGTTPALTINHTTNNATFSGDVLVEDNLYLTDAGTVRGKIQLNASDRDDLDIKAVSLGSNMKFFTVDTERMRITSAGNVAIGDTSSNFKLKVQTTGWNGIQVNSTTTNGAVLNLTTTQRAFELASRNNSFQIRDLTAGDTPRLTINSSGNVGIGTGTTNPGAKLQVYSTATRDISIFGHGTQAQNNWQAEHAFFISAGQAVMISKANASNNTNRLHLFYSTTNGDAQYMLHDTSSVNKVKLNTNGDSYFNGGNVGIGTTSPLSKLNVNGSIKIEGENQLYFGSSGSTPLWGIKALGNDLIINEQGTNSGDLIFTGENLGVGITSPLYKLDVDGTLRTRAQTTSDWGLVSINSAAGATSGLWFNNGSGELLLRRSDNSLQTKISSTSSSYINGGDVGIGTTSPSERLHVSGEPHPSIRLSSSSDSDYNVVINCGYRDEALNLSVGGYKVFTTEGYNTPETTHLYSNNSKALSLASNQAATFTSTVTATNFINSSDERLKENIEKVCNNSLDVQWKTFEFKSDRGQKRYGVIAQELEKTNPEFVREDAEGFKSVAYIDLLIAKIAELEERIQTLENK